MTNLKNTQAKDVSTKIRKLAFLMNRIAGETLRQRNDLTFSEFRMLRILTHAGGLSQKAIAQFHGITDAAVSRQVDQLVKKKLLTRAVNPTNRREHVLMLTPTGTKAADRAKAVLESKFNELFGVLSDRQQQTFRDVLDTLLNAIWEEHGRLMCGRRPGGHHEQA